MKLNKSTRNSISLAINNFLTDPPLKIRHVNSLFVR